MDPGLGFHQNRAIDSSWRTFLKVVIDESDNINHVIELTEGRVFSSGSESLSISLSALTFLGCNQCNLLFPEPEQTG